MSALQPLQRLQFVPRPSPSLDISEKGELVWLPLSQLYIDPIYQRAILESGRANIRRMVEGFSWLLFGTVIVARRGPRQYAVIDGQHRATAALLHGKVTDVPCLVLKGGPAAEARAFSAINGNVTRIHALQSFRASVAAGEATAVALVALCGRSGVTIAPYPKVELLPGETLALGTIKTCARRYGDKVLLAALSLLRAIDDKAGLGAASIMGACALLNEKPEMLADIDKVGAFLARRGGGLSALVDQARARKGTRGGTEWANFAAVLSSAITMAGRSGGAPMSRLMAGR